MEGALLVVKPPGMTSHDVVEWTRRLAGVKTGHTGTLDPAAAGLMVLCLGRATRLAPYLSGCDKRYRAELTFGRCTDSGDAEGEPIAAAPVAHLTAAAVRAALAGLEGETVLPVPRLSAVKQAGRPLHRRTRRGEQVDPPLRPMRVARWELLELWPGPPPAALTELDCASGTYVRSLVIAVARALGTEAYLSCLVRTRVGGFDLAEALTLEEIAEAAAGGSLASALLSPAATVGHLPPVTLPPPQLQRLAQGGQVPAPAGLAPPPGPPWRVLDAAGRLWCVARAAGEPPAVCLQPEVVLPPPPEGEA